MNYLILLLSIAISTSLYSSEITFVELKAHAIKNNFDILKSKNVIKNAAISRFTTTRRLYLPKLTMGLSVYDKDYKKGIFTDNSFEQNNDKLFSSNIALSFNLFNGLKDYNNNRLSKINLDKSELLHKQAIENLIYKLSSKFLEYSLEQNRLTIIKEELSRDNQLLKSALTKFKKGIISRTDLKRTKLQKIGSNQNYQSQLHNIKNLIDSLKSIAQYKGTLKLTPLSYRSLDRETIKFLAGLEKNGIENYSQNHFKNFKDSGTELLIEQTNYQSQEKKVLITQGDFLPKLSLSAGHNYSFSKDFDNHNNSKSDEVVIALNMTIPIFDSFDTMAATRQEKLQLINNKHSVNQLRDATKTQLDQMNRTLLNDYSSYKSIKEKFKLTEYIYKMALKRFNIGAVSTQDLITDKILFQQTQFALAATGYTIRQKILQIKKITGKLNVLKEK